MAEDILTARPGTYQQDVLQTFCHCERGMIEAAKAYTANYEVYRMSRAAMTHLLILKRSYKEGRGHPYYTSGDVPTGRPGQSELSGSAKSRGNSGFPCSMLMVIIFIPPSANFCEATFAILIWSAIFEGEMLTDNFLCSRTVAFHRK